MQQTCARGTPHFSLHFATCARDATHYVAFFVPEIHSLFAGNPHFFAGNPHFFCPKSTFFCRKSAFCLVRFRVAWQGRCFGFDQAGPLGRAGLAWSTLAWLVLSCSQQRWAPEQPAGTHLCWEQHSIVQANVTQAGPTQPNGPTWSSPKQTPCQASQLSLPRQPRAVGRCERLWREWNS